MSADPSELGEKTWKKGERCGVFQDEYTGSWVPKLPIAIPPESQGSWSTFSYLEGSYQLLYHLSCLEMTLGNWDFCENTLSKICFIE